MSVLSGYMTIGRSRPYWRDAQAIMNRGDETTLSTADRTWLNDIDGLPVDVRRHAAEAARSIRFEDYHRLPGPLSTASMHDLALVGQIHAWLLQQPITQSVGPILEHFRQLHRHRSGVIGILDEFTSVLFSETDGLVQARNPFITGRQPSEMSLSENWDSFRAELARVLLMGEWTELTLYRKSCGGAGGTSSATTHPAPDDLIRLLRGGDGLSVAKVKIGKEPLYVITCSGSLDGLGKFSQCWPVNALRRWSPTASPPRLPRASSSAAPARNEVLVRSASTPEEAARQLVQACQHLCQDVDEWGVHLSVPSASRGLGFYREPAQRGGGNGRGLIRGYCAACHHGLTDALSAARGYGPHCYSTLYGDSTRAGTWAHTRSIPEWAQRVADVWSTPRVSLSDSGHA